MSDKIAKESINSAAPNWDAIVEEAAPEAQVQETSEEIPQGVPETVPETAPEVQETPQVDPIQESRLNEFVRKEGEWIQKEQDYKNKLERLSVFEEFESLKENNPLEALAKVGINIDDIVNKSLGLGEKEKTPEEIAEAIAERKLQEFKDEQQKHTEAVRQAELVKNFKSNIGSTIQENVEKYELCSLEGDQAIEDAVKVVEWELQNSGNLMSIDQALDAVEAHYEAQAKKYAAAKKLGLQSPVQENQPAVQETKPQPAKTLTTKSVSTAVRTNQGMNFGADDYAAKKAAAALIQWK